MVFPVPQVTLTVRQLYLPNREIGDAQPALRTASLGLRDSIDLSENLRLEYGISVESLSFLERVTYMSPFARATYDLGKFGAVKFAYSSGTQPAAFAATHNANPESGATNTALNQDLAALAQLPQISRRDDQDRCSGIRTSSSVTSTSRDRASIRPACIARSVSNATLMLSDADRIPAQHRHSARPRRQRSDFQHRQLFPRWLHRRRSSNRWAITWTCHSPAGHTGALWADPRQATGNTGDDVRAMIHEVERPWLAAGLSTTIPLSGTFVMTAYGWTDPRVLMPDHVFMTQDISQSTGLNIRSSPAPAVVLRHGRAAGGDGRASQYARAGLFAARRGQPQGPAHQLTPHGARRVWPSFSDAVSSACSKALTTP